MSPEIIAISSSRRKGTRKENVDEAVLVTDEGIEGDAHAGKGLRQVSLLAIESIEKMVSLGLNVTPGDFAENITLKGLDLLALPIGQKIRLGDEALVEITLKGKECHERCSIYYTAGDCVMPREGVFCKVVSGGIIRPGDPVILA